MASASEIVAAMTQIEQQARQREQQERAVQLVRARVTVAMGGQEVSESSPLPAMMARGTVSGRRPGPSVGWARPPTGYIIMDDRERESR